VDGVVALSAGQMSYPLEAIDCRNPQQTFRPRRPDRGRRSGKKFRGQA